jgi:prepilin-type processing-associated H-X9-DG protein
MDDQVVGELIRLLPFVKRDDLYKNFSFDPRYDIYSQNPYNLPPGDGTDNIPRPPDLYGCEGEVDVYLCPDGPQPGETVTALLTEVYGTLGIDFPNSVRFLHGHVFPISPGRLVMARSHYLGMAGDFRTGQYARFRGIFTYNSQTRLSDLERGPENTILYAEYWGGYVDWNGVGGVPSGWTNGSRSVGFNYSAFGTCPSDPLYSSCDYQHSFGLSFGTFGALHRGLIGGHPYTFNVAMADGSVRSLPGDINFLLWETLCGIHGGGNPVGRLEPEEPWAGIDY